MENIHSPPFSLYQAEVAPFCFTRGKGAKRRLLYEKWLEVPAILQPLPTGSLEEIDLADSRYPLNVSSNGRNRNFGRHGRDMQGLNTFEEGRGPLET